MPGLSDDPAGPQPLPGSSDNLAGAQLLQIVEHAMPAGFALSLASACVTEPGEENAKASMCAKDECETDCVICWERRACFVMGGCGHLVFCAKCRQVSCKARDLEYMLPSQPYDHVENSKHCD